MGSLADRLVRRETQLAVIGLGYVGLPLAAAFSRHCPVIGFDISERKVEELRRGYDSTGELTAEEMAEARITYTTDPADLAPASLY
ncbi:MAG: nucleotide sugar dehydrogenase, partial [Nitrospirae bacterium]